MKRISEYNLLKEERRAKRRKKKLAYDDDIDEQINDDLYTEITTNATEVILPTNIKKYFGQVSPPKGRDKKWRSQFQKTYKYKSSGHDSKQQAIDHVKKINIQERWPIRNIVYKYGDEYYCDLTRGQVTLFSPGRMEIIQNYTWHASPHSKKNLYYAEAYDSVKKKMIYYHQIIHPGLGKKESVDHINKISLDNSDANMRVASMRTQILNRDVMITNTTGVTGVQVSTCKYYIAAWVDEDHIPRQELFSMKIHGKRAAFEMAVAYRKHIEETLPHYILALQNK